MGCESKIHFPVARQSTGFHPVAEELSPEDAYDVIFVAVRYTQIETILETLRASRAKTIIFADNMK